jgi:hypothetical protein
VLARRSQRRTRGPTTRTSDVSVQSASFPGPQWANYTPCATTAICTRTARGCASTPRPGARTTHLSCTSKGRGVFEGVEKALAAVPAVWPPDAHPRTHLDEQPVQRTPSAGRTKRRLSTPLLAAGAVALFRNPSPPRVTPAGSRPHFRFERRCCSSDVHANAQRHVRQMELDCGDALGSHDNRAWSVDKTLHIRLD